MNFEEFRENVFALIHYHGSMDFGYDSGYYWEVYVLTKTDDGRLKVVVDIGSGSGYGRQFKTTEVITIEEFYEFAKSKLFYNNEASMYRIIEKTLEDYIDIIH